MATLALGFVLGALTVGVTLAVAELRRPINPHCDTCAKLVTACRCEGGSNA